MALDLPGGLFEQRDVRETPASSSSVTTVTDAEYVTLANHADLTDERVLTGGTGITLTDGGANSTATISLTNKTSYWSCSGHNFLPAMPDTNDVYYQTTNSGVISSAENIDFNAPVFIPQGAVITAAKVFGNAGATAENWILYRAPLTTGSGGVMGGGSIGTEDVTISDATIDNETYCYWIFVSTLDTNDEVYGARITYTTDYD